MIATVYNEAKSISVLLDSIQAQSRLPDEIVIVDAGSTDDTPRIIESYAATLPLKILISPGCNISQGRNLAITAATGEIIASTDAGVRLSPNWLADIIAPVERGESPIAAGFFVADPQTAFETAMGATVLPHRREINPRSFLPSSRSVAFAKEAWRATGGYPEWLDYCEDLLFDFALRKLYGPFAWVPGAVAHFRPRPSLRSFFLQYYRYARGDGKALLWTKRHLVRYATYVVGPALILTGFWWPWLWLPVVVGAAAYLATPYRRLFPMLHDRNVFEKLAAVCWVPLIRITGDLAKMIGYPAGLVWHWRHRRAIHA